MSSGEYCGESTIAATWSTPAAASERSPSAIDGAEKRIPVRTAASPPSAASSAAAWAAVIATSGEPPMTW